jgi:hypothetical protein
MREVIIERVRLDPHRRLRLRPTPSRVSGYESIYRSASKVRWDDLCGELYVHDVPEFSTVDEYKQIVAAVAREYGDQLILSPSTAYVDVPSDVITALRERGPVNSRI